MAHNYSSHDPSPSPEDVALTRATVQAGKLFVIQLQDPPGDRRQWSLGVFTGEGIRVFLILCWMDTIPPAYFDIL